MSVFECVCECVCGRGCMHFLHAQVVSVQLGDVVSVQLVNVLSVQLVQAELVVRVVGVLLRLF